MKNFVSATLLIVADHDCLTLFVLGDHKSPLPPNGIPPLEVFLVNSCNGPTTLAACGHEDYYRGQPKMKEAGLI